jgi:hypothetical protein
MCSVIQPLSIQSSDASLVTNEQRLDGQCSGRQQSRQQTFALAQIGFQGKSIS